MFLRVVILVFTATCCTARVIDVCDRPSAWERSGKFEGDIMLTDQQMRNGVNDTARRWPNKVVPFRIDSVFTEEDRNTILRAIENYHQNTTIRFKQYDPWTDRDYIYVTGEDTGCWSYVGRVGGPQRLNLQRGEFGCLWHGTILHELLHALGFYHQHRAPERDEYITINWENIIPGMEHYFDKYNASTITSFGEPYDYDSIMHYGPCVFSKNGLKTIEPKEPDEKIGQNRRLSPIDIAKLGKMYEGPSYVTDENSSYATRSPFITLIIITLNVLTHLQ